MVSNLSLHPQKLYNSLQLHTNASLADFKKCLIHISVFEDKPNSANPGNSRFVFAGMYAFKGVLSQLVLKYISGNGKQLQHFLGNAFNNDKLEKLFDDLELGKVCHIHESLEMSKYKHIFAQGYLGFLVTHCSQSYCESVAYRYFIEPSGHILPKVVHLNPIEILNAKVGQVLDDKIKIVQSESEGIYSCQVKLNTGKILAEHASVSKLYAKKKAIKLATKVVLDLEAQDPKHKAILERQNLLEEQKLLRDKALKQKAHEKLIEQKREKRLIAKETKRKEAKEREFRRTLNKANAKKSNESNKAKKKNTTFDSDLRTLSSKKRRFIEDKLK